MCQWLEVEIESVILFYLFFVEQIIELVHWLAQQATSGCEWITWRWWSTPSERRHCLCIFMVDWFRKVFYWLAYSDVLTASLSPLVTKHSTRLCWVVWLLGCVWSTHPPNPCISATARDQVTTFRSYTQHKLHLISEGWTRFNRRSRPYR